MNFIAEKLLFLRNETNLPISTPMKRLSFIIALLALTCAAAWAEQPKYSDYFNKNGLRFDYYHSGDANSEAFHFKEFVDVPYYAGSKVNLIDTCGYGVYQIRLIDKESGKLIYQHNFNSLMQEWLTTPEAKEINRSMPESVLLPMPKRPTELQLWSRDKKLQWHHKYTHQINPDDYFIRKFKPWLESFDVSYMGNPDHCIDIVLISEGFTEAEKAQFIEDCDAFVDYLFSYAPYGDNKARFNVRAVWAPSLQSGVSIPGEDKWVNTACDARYYTFDSERYQMITDMIRLSDIASHVPYDLIYVITNSQKYGGGAIYNWYGISAAHIKSRPASTRKTYAHEFGHLLLGLGDEYVGGAETDLYDLHEEPWEPNLTTLTNFDVKWKDLVDKSTPIPPPVPKGYSHQQEYKMSDFKVGVYEGGGYLEKGIYRPVPNCMMNVMHTQDEFCPVCDRAIRAYIDFLTE